MTNSRLLEQDSLDRIEITLCIIFMVLKGWVYREKVRAEKKLIAFRIKRLSSNGKLKGASYIQGTRLNEAPSIQGQQRKRESKSFEIKPLLKLSFG
jgi:hypothetical protein